MRCTLWAFTEFKHYLQQLKGLVMLHAYAYCHSLADALWAKMKVSMNTSVCTVDVTDHVHDGAHACRGDVGCRI